MAIARKNQHVWKVEVKHAGISTVEYFVWTIGTDSEMAVRKGLGVAVEDKLVDTQVVGLRYLGELRG